jgi:hypothetical protein
MNRVPPHYNTLVDERRKVYAAELEDWDNMARLRREKHNTRNKLWRLQQWKDMGMWNDDRDFKWIDATAYMYAIDDRITELKREQNN